MTRAKIDGLETWVTAFLRDCKTRGLSAFTVEFYRAQLQIFTTYCNGERVTEDLKKRSAKRRHCFTCLMLGVVHKLF